MGLIRRSLFGRLLALLFCVVLGLLGSGCDGPPAGETAPSSQIAEADDGAVRAALNRLSRAVGSRDATAYAALTAPLDAGQAQRTQQLWRNLASLRPTEWRLRVRGRTNRGGADPWPQPVTVTWRLADDRGPAEHELILILRRAGGGIRLAGVELGPSTRPAPIWAVQEVVVRRRNRVTVAAPTAAAAATWLARAQPAVDAVAPRLPPILVGGEPAPALVVEIPVTRQGFEQILGVRPGSYRDLAAVAWPEGPNPSRSAIRIVVNPAAVARLDATALAILLAHEVVHVATRSAASSAPTWLVEGYADYLAYEAYPAAQPAAAADLLAEVAAEGAPSTLPTEGDFAPGRKSLALSYAAAWTACRYIAATFSPSALAQFYRRLDAGETLPYATRAALGTSPAGLTAGWRQSLDREASRR